jgi:hypothetical protein
MTFIDQLRQARFSSTAVLHEFLTQFDPAQQKVHAFFEGHDDGVFYGKFLNQRIPVGTRLCTYRCEGKAKVYEVFGQIIARYPKAKNVLFFVDKDLDDILGEPWPTDPRIYVTDVYSIENFLVSKDVLYQFFQESIRLSVVDFPIEPILARFDVQLARFHCLTTVVMAWVVAVRRAGLRPNLNDVNVGELFTVSDDCMIRARCGCRVEYLHRTTGIQKRADLTRRVLQTAKELKRISPKRVIRGKFEAWFFVEFWKHLIRQMRTLAREANGNLNERIQLERSNFVAVLGGRLEIPRSLELFLGQHLVDNTQPIAGQPTATSRTSLTVSILNFLRNLIK